MDTSINSRPLLQSSETDSDFEVESQKDLAVDGGNDVLVVPKDSRTLKHREPIDRFNASYFVFYLLGTTALLPWFFFITAEEYWMFKFRDLSNNSTSASNRSELQACFTSYISIASTVPSTIALLIIPFVGHKIPLKIRMVVTLSFMLVFFILTTVLVNIDTDHWQNEFFTFTLVSVVLLNIASSIFQCGLFGVVGKFPPQYITATVSGQALGGMLAALAEIGSLWLGASPTSSAFVYFLTADVFILISLVSFLFLSNSKFYNYYVNNTPRSSEDYQYEQLPRSIEDSPIVRHISYLDILKKIWIYGLSVWLCYTITLSIYPSVTGLVSSTRGHSTWSDIYFVPVICYLLFSVNDYMGRLLAGYLRWPNNKPWLVFFLSTLRFVFIPFFMLCNAQPRHHLRVMVHSDYIFIAMTVIFGLTNGYFTNITMLSVPKIVHVHEIEVASSMMATFLGVGLAFGSTLGLIFIELL
ncbi:equilibrative nucleoside transporter 3 [Nilaparvata lugens]|uniref:equilibrative nucleoside transporter 3 n=1 Tax=Nilaparvata lugens TaxID=108931 RepID=UPI00193C99D9|nr:equilibrative nucleoside transporter 3 [Nilaparvata lugens]